MKMKHVVIILGLTLSMALFTGCGSDDASSNNTTAETSANAPSEMPSGMPEMDSDAVYGEVSKIDGKTITINVGTQKERDNPGEASGEAASSEAATEVDASSSASLSTEGEKPSMLELTGETKEIEVTDSTEIVRQSMGGMGFSQPPSGEKPENMPEGDKPDMPSGEKPENTPSGEKPENMPEGGPPSAETETITIDDISEGDTVAISSDDSGNVTKIVVISMGSKSN